MKILFANPNTTVAVTDRIAAVARAANMAAALPARSPTAWFIWASVILSVSGMGLL